MCRRRRRCSTSSATLSRSLSRWRAKELLTQEETDHLTEAGHRTRPLCLPGFQRGNLLPDRSQVVSEMRDGTQRTAEGLFAVERMRLDRLAEVIVPTAEFAYQALPCRVIHRIDLPAFLPVPPASVASDPR